MLSVDRVLQLFDLFAEEFDDLAGVESHHVIVVRTAVQFEDGVATFEIVALDKARGLELRQHPRSEEHTSELQSLMRISYAVFCLKKKKPRMTKSIRKQSTTRKLHKR